MNHQNHHQSSPTAALLTALLVVIAAAAMPVVAAVEDGEEAATGEVTVTAEPPHPDVDEIRLIDPDIDDTDRTEEGVVTPGEEYVLEVDLDTDHELENALERLEIELYRGDSVDDTPGDSSQEGVYEINVTYDGSGSATATSESGPDPDLSVRAADVDLEATSDTAEITIDIPEETLPTANSDDESINEQTWVVGATAVNEDIIDQEEPEVTHDTFDVSVLLDANLRAGEVQMEGGALPGTENVPLSASGDESVELKAAGNVDIKLGMNLDHLEYDAGDETYTVDAENAHVLTGDDLDVSDHNHSDAQQFGETPVNLVEDGSPVVVSPGETVEIRMWVDIPGDTPPGDYSGNFAVVVAEDAG